MVVGCDWSATGCRYSVTVALLNLYRVQSILNISPIENGTIEETERCAFKFVTIIIANECSK